VVGVLSSAIAAFFYIRVIVMMFFADPIEDPVAVTIPSMNTRIVIAVSALVTLAMGVYPTPVFDAISSLATFIHG
jgi:NADH-quinone oxidoreductase subunit N